ncbi:hypothetical protein SHKM778_96110 (plasmid) [Streptomyces sp. KM77-8]|uniref:Uncharacterized protein n=1 Tax=Streptomyces haneummycinicus TaxID=3074435 RepID=A0AAT9HZW2_9ACTN
MALHHLQILEKQLQLCEIAVHRLGRGRDLATADGARARTHLEGSPAAIRWCRRSTRRAAAGSRPSSENENVNDAAACGFSGISS